MTPGMTAGESWQWSFESAGPAHERRLVGINIRRKLGESFTGTLLTLDIWQEDGEFHTRIVRPVVGDEFTLFPFPASIPVGRYVYIVRAGETTALGGRFRIRPP
jgi:hypothetical protein